VPTLKIDLQEGFAGDHVVVEVDGQVVLDKQSVTTRQQVGLASSVQVETGLTAELRVELPEKGIEGSESVQVGQKPNVGVLVDGGEVHFKYPPEGQVMFGYV
jgi:hypothetical protein